MTSRSKWSEAEIKQLKQYAGVKPAAVIAEILGRSACAVRHQIQRQGLDGRLYGENHWNAKIENITAQMMCVLHDSGFTVNEIATVFDKKVHTVGDICAGRKRVNDHGINSKTHRR